MIGCCGWVHDLAFAQFFVMSNQNSEQATAGTSAAKECSAVTLTTTGRHFDPSDSSERVTCVAESHFLLGLGHEHSAKAD